jgi:hypothetical protein
VAAFEDPPRIDANSECVLGHNSAMRAVVSIVVLMTACAGTTPARVVNLEGQPLHTSARLDAEVEPITVQCGLHTYLVVAEPNRFLLGVHVGTRIPHVHDAVSLCERIRAERM